MRRKPPVERIGIDRKSIGKRFEREVPRGDAVVATQDRLAKRMRAE